MCSEGRVAPETSAGDVATYPGKPYVPPLLSSLTVLVLGDNLLLRGVVDAMPLLAGAVLAPFCGAVLRLRGRGTASWHVLACGMAIVLSCACCVPALSRLDAAALELGSTPVSRLEMVVASEPSQTQSGWLCRADCSLPSGAVGHVWLAYSERLPVGERLRAVGRFSANGGDEWGLSSRAAGLVGRVKVVRVLEEAPPEGVHAALGGLRGCVLGAIDPSSGPGAALLAGLVAGERAELKARGISDEFAAAGLAHLVAVSGSHLAVFSSVVEAALVALGVSSGSRVVAGLGLCAAFVALCGAPASALRAWIMLAAPRSARLVGRRGHAPSGLALAGLAMCLANPHCACDLGFQLSVLSVASLVLFSGWFEAAAANVLGGHRSTWRSRLPRMLRGPLSKLGRYVRSSVCSSLVCQAATLPLVVASFGRVSLVSVLSNLVVGPAFAPLLCVALAALTVCWMPVVGPVALCAARLFAGAVVEVVGWLASLPLASVAATAPGWAALVPLVVGSVLLSTWPRPSPRALRMGCAALFVPLVALALRLYVLVPPSVTVLDVGQGDAILIRDGPHVVLVDTGPAGTITPALARHHVAWLDAVVVTHLHDDHTGGIDELAGLVSCGDVLVGRGVGANLGSLEDDVGRLARNGVEELGVGDSLRVGGFKITCLWPDEPTDGSENEDSVCLLVEYEGLRGEMSVLLTGDAESNVLQAVAPRAGDVDALKVGHHGSRVSITTEEAAELAPEVAVASAGEGNSYGHPTPECREVLEGAGSTFLCTIERGDVTLEPDPMGVRVTSQR